MESLTEEKRPTVARKVWKTLSDNWRLLYEAAIRTFPLKRIQGRPIWVASKRVAGELHRAGYRNPEYGDFTARGVSALLHAAYESGIIEIFVHEPEELRKCRELATALRETFPLRDCRLVPGDPDTRESLDRHQRESIYKATVARLAHEAIAYLYETLAWMASERPGVQRVIAIAWGRTMDAFASRLRTSPVRLPANLPLLVVPLIAPTCEKRATHVEANNLATILAGPLGASWLHLNCPAFWPRERLDRLKDWPEITDVLEIIRMADIVFTSMGPIGEVDDPSEIRISNDPERNQRLFQAMLDAWAIGDLCGCPFTREGREAPTDWATIGLGLEGFRALAADARRRVVMVCGGDRRRVEALRVALRSGLVSVLITDTVTAAMLLEAEAEAKKSA